MSDDIKALQAGIFLSSLGFSIFGAFNLYYGYNYLYYRRMKEIGITEFMDTDFKKTQREYLIRGKVECPDPLKVSGI